MRAKRTIRWQGNFSNQKIPIAERETNKNKEKKKENNKKVLIKNKVSRKVKT